MLRLLSVWLLVAPAVVAPRSAAADEPLSPAQCPASCGIRATINHPPAFNFTDRAYPLHPNRRFDARLRANDADGDILHYTADKLPLGATFDEKSGRITWMPTAQQMRQHAVDITASDGCAEAKTTVILDVRTNRAPTTRQHDLIVVIPGDDTDAGDAIVANDLDSDELSATPIEMPQGAELLARASQVVLHWRPTDADIGQHPLVFTLSDGETSATIHNMIVVVPRRDADEWGRALLPGIGPTSFLTHAQPELFAGGSSWQPGLTSARTCGLATRCG